MIILYYSVMKYLIIVLKYKIKYGHIEQAQHFQKFLPHLKVF